MWDLWWTTWQWDRFICKSFCFLLSVSFHHCSTSICVSSGGWTFGPLTAHFHRDIISVPLAAIKNQWGNNLLCGCLYLRNGFYTCVGFAEARRGHHVVYLGAFRKQSTIITPGTEKINASRKIAAFIEYCTCFMSCYTAQDL
jgi:hypothetical protein